MYPDAMRVALARHDALMRRAIEGSGGVVFKTVGDAFCAAFASSPPALRATVQAQHALQHEPWPSETPLRVRMALHTGVAEARDNDYFGAVLNRVARLLATGHGEQTLVSGATHELVRDHLPEGVGLRDLGMHRLKDLERPEQVYQVTHPDLAAIFPPLRSLNSTPNNLPRQLTSFIGREKELAAVTALLGTAGDAGFLTLAGPGGTGKTRLSLQAAAELLDQYSDGVWLVELAPLGDPALVPPAVASVLGVREQPGKSVLQTLTGYLKDRRLLLLMDNCEHLLSACAQFIAAVLRSCPQVRVLATSREPLGITGEHVYRVPSLSLPDPKRATTATPKSLAQYESVRLFIDRALLVKSDFAVTNSSAPAVAQLCHRLDGIPLALELAATRVRSLSVEDINGRLDRRFRLLTGGDRSALPRQQTLRALVDWSYDLLSAQEKTLLARLSVFSGGWTLAAAEAMCGFDPIEDWEVLDLLTSLVDKSLASLTPPESEEEGGGPTRYGMLETLRQYAREKLQESGEEEELQRRHWDWFLALAEGAEPHLKGPDQVTWLSRLETEHGNLRAALDASAARAEADTATWEVGLRLAGALWQFWSVRGYLTEGREYLDRALRLRPAAAEGAPQGAVTGMVAKALGGTGRLASNQGDYEAARAFFEESLSLWQLSDDKNGMAFSLVNLGILAYSQGDHEAARVLYEQCLALYREAGNKSGIADSLGNLGILADNRGDYPAARALYDEGLALYRELGNKRGAAISLLNLGTIADNQGDYEVGRALYEECLLFYRELGDKGGIAVTLANLACSAYDQGDYESSRALHEESLSLRRELGDRRGIANSLASLGIIANSQGDYAAGRALFEESLRLRRALGDRRSAAFSLAGMAVACLGESDARGAVILWGAASALRESVGSPLPPGDQAKEDQNIEQARAALSALSSDEGGSDEAFADAWEEGRSMYNNGF
jgi:predicted ATPase